MSRLTDDQEFDFEDAFSEDISDDDYGFIVGPDGELKSIFLPTVVPFNPPKKLAKLLKALGVTDLGNVEGNETIH